MAGRRYSAGRIFLDVVPSFKGVMREIGREADKVRQQVNADDAKAAEQGAKEVGKATRREAVAQERETQKAIAEERRAAWAKLSIEERRQRATELRQRQDAARRAVNKELEGLAHKQRKLASANARNLAQEEKARREAAERTERWVNGVILRSQATRNREILQREREHARRLQQERLSARREADQAEDRLNRERNARDLAGIREAARVASQANRDRIADSRRAAGEWERAFKDAEKEVERSLTRQGGRFGQEFRKSIDRALKDLPEAHEVDIDIDSSGARAELNAIRAQLETLRNQRIGVDIDSRRARSTLRDLERQLSRVSRRSYDIDVKTNAKSAAVLLGEMREEMDRGSRAAGILTNRHKQNRDQALDTANAFRLFNAMILAAVLIIPLLAPAIAGLTAALGGLIPMLLGAGAGLGVMLMGFSGIGDAVKALGDQQENAAKDTLAASKTMRNAARAVRDAEQGVVQAREMAGRQAEESARRVADAQQGVADAQERAADQIENALRRQENAERSLMRAQKEARQAQADLARARREAAEEAADRELAMRGGALAERQAKLDLFEAQGAWITTRDDGTANGADRERANIAYERAKLQLEEIQRRNKELKAEEEQFRLTGVEGTERVLDAKERLADSISGVKDAEREVADAAVATARAQRDAARLVAEAQQNLSDAILAQQRQQEDSARSIRDAQERLTDAQAAYQEALEQTAEIGSASMRKLEEAMNRLSPAGQRFARFLFGLRDYWDSLRFAAQEGMLPGVQQFLEDMIETYGPGFLRFVTSMSKVLGALFIQMGEVFRGPIMTEFFTVMEKYSGVFTEQVATILLNLMEMFAALSVAFAPFGAAMGAALVEITAGWASWAEGLQDSEGFQKFLDYASTSGKAVLEMLVALGAALINIGIGLAPYADMMVTMFTGLFDWIAEADPETVGQITAAILTMVVAMQVASAALSGLSTFKMFFSKDATGGFAHPLGMLSLVLVGMVGLGAILATEYEWFAEALEWAGERVAEFIGWASQFRAELALLAFAVAGGYAIWKSYQLGVMGWHAAVRLAAAAQTMFTKKVAIFGVTSKLAMGWIFAIVAAVVAIGAALVWLYRNNEGFKNFVDGTWGYMQRIAGQVASWFMDNIFPALVAAWEWFGSVALGVWNDYIFPALEGLWHHAQMVFGWIVDTGLPMLQAGLEWVGNFFMAVWNDVLRPVFMWLWDIAQIVFGWLVNTGFPAVMAVLGWFGEFFMAIWNGYLEPVLTRLWKLAQWVGAFLVEHVFPAIGEVIVWLGGVLMDIWNNVLQPTLVLLADIFLWLWHNVVTPALQGIGNVIAWVWENVIQPVFDFLMTAVEEGGGWFTWLLEEVVDPMFTGLGEVIEWVWENVIEPVFGGIGDAIQVLVDIFSAGVEGMGNAWSWLKEFLTTPLRAVIEFVNEYLIGGINTVLGWVGLDGINEITIPKALRRTPVKIPSATGYKGNTGGKNRIARASGGVLPGYSPGKDNFHFIGSEFDLSLAGGEAIMRPEWTAAVGHGTVERWNAAARSGGTQGVRRAMGFADGGVLPNRKAHTGGLGDVWDALGDFAQGLGKFLRDPLGYLKSMFMKGVDALGDNPFVEFATKGVSKIAGAAKDKLLEMIGWGSSDLAMATEPAIPGGLPWQAIWGMVQMLNPFAWMTSGYRSRKLTASGFTSYHSLGRAVDFVSPNMAKSWETLVHTGMPWTELYYSPMGFMRHGRMIPASMVSPLTRQNHYDHVHVAMERGGIIPTRPELMEMLGMGNTVGNLLGTGNAVSDLLGARADAGFEGEANLGVYDTGGILQPGDLAINLGSTPERITTEAQWSEIERAALGNGESVTYAPQLTSVQGATAEEILDVTDWEFKRLARSHKYGRQGG